MSDGLPIFSNFSILGVLFSPELTSDVHKQKLYFKWKFDKQAQQSVQ